MGAQFSVAMQHLVAATILSSVLFAFSLAMPHTALTNVGCIDFQVHSDVANVTKTFRGSGDHKDPGWGVDMIFSGRSAGEQTVHTSIWDTDGDGFFMIQVGKNYCKVDSGSNGLAPGATAEVFEISGLKCTLTSTTSVPQSGCFKFGVFLNETHAADCVTPESHRAPTG